MTMKMNWDETVTRIYKEVPETEAVDWERVFREDPKILGNIVNDIIKVSVSKRGRPGKRSASSEEDVTADLRKLTGSDFSELPFSAALRVAMGSKSLRQTAMLAGLDKMTVHRLLNDEGKPATAVQMEMLAGALKKDPSYFVEYRAAYVCQALFKMLCDNSESAAVFYKKLKKKESNVWRP